MNAFVIAAPIPEMAPINAKFSHQNGPSAIPFWNELYINKGIFNIMRKSNTAKLMTNIFDDVRNVFALNDINEMEYVQNGN